MFEKPRNIEYINNKRKVRPEGRALRWVAFIFLVGLIVLSLALTACNIDDDRDICCEGVRLEYRYVRQNQDEYEKFVKDMHHFLFDGEGKFMYEVPQNSATPQVVRLNGLSIGEYTMITVGNASAANTRLTPLTPGESNLQTMLLSLANMQPDENHANNDQLFWNARRFTVERNKEHRYVCDLSNVHCHLFVRVYWNNLPPHNGGDYTMRLEEVPVEYTLDPLQEHTRLVISNEDEEKGNTSTGNRVIHTFPGLTGKLGKHFVRVPLYNFELQGELITLRYTNDRIPVFRLWHGNEPVTKPIDLKKAFTAWEWFPDEHPEQIYRIEMEIFDDGTVVVNQWVDATVLDWIDGGTFWGNP